MKSFITNIESAIETEPNEVSSPLLPPTEAPTRLPSTESEFSWIRKTVLEQLQLLKDDIRDADDKIDESLENCLGKNQGSEKFVLVFESFLDNKSILDCIINLGWKPIIVRNQRSLPSLKTDAVKEGMEAGKKQQKSQEKEAVKQILVSEISSYLHKCHSVIICSDSITKTGGVLGGSGSLMLSMMARRRRVPVIVISRNYCLNDRVLLTQKTLTTDINPSQHFKISHDDFSLYITKNEDFIESKYIDLMITQRGCWMVDEISHVQDRYWRY